jgi:glycerol-1-phosphate dehydrogenase [NAD(P)+]
MMAMFTAPADWMLAATVGQDSHFDPKVVELFRDSGPDFLASAAGVAAGDEVAISLLARLLTASGLAMGVSSVTAPLSGTEHLISHMLDMSAGVDKRPVGLHGTQVGIASLVAACLWEHVLDSVEPDDFLRECPDSDEMRLRVMMAFASLDPTGRTAAECWSGYGRKLALWEGGLGRRTALASSWSSLKGDLAAMLGDPDAMARALRSAGAPASFRQLDRPIALARVQWAASSCHLMRDRFTVADLAFFTGHWSDGDIDAVLDRAAMLAGD